MNSKKILVDRDCVSKYISSLGPKHVDIDAIIPNIINCSSLQSQLLTQPVAQQVAQSIAQPVAQRPEKSFAYHPMAQQMDRQMNHLRNGNLDHKPLNQTQHPIQTAVKRPVQTPVQHSVQHTKSTRSIKSKEGFGYINKSDCSCDPTTNLAIIFIIILILCYLYNYSQEISTK